jgi:hypothetical protein
MDIKKYIAERVERVRVENVLKSRNALFEMSPVAFADSLVAAGVIKDEFTDLSGEKASSKLAFIVEDIINKFGVV